MDIRMMAGDLLVLALGVALYAVGHYHGRVDTLAALKRSGMVTKGARYPVPFWLGSLGAFVLLLLLCRWAGVFS